MAKAMERIAERDERRSFLIDRKHREPFGSQASIISAYLPLRHSFYLRRIFTSRHTVGRDNCWHVSKEVIKMRSRLAGLLALVMIRPLLLERCGGEQGLRRKRSSTR